MNRETKYERSINEPMRVLMLAHFGDQSNMQRCCRCGPKPKSEFSSSHSRYCHSCRKIIVYAKRDALKPLTREERELIRKDFVIPDLSDEIIKERIYGPFPKN